MMQGLFILKRHLAINVAPESTDGCGSVLGIPARARAIGGRKVSVCISGDEDPSMPE
jgi:hypothetical protein